FAALLEKAIALGFDAVCTGHYAKVIRDEAGNPELHRAADWAKDQSYVLGVLTHQQLEHCIFPLADTPSKAEVRAEAEARGLSVAKKPDSHDICFIPDGDTRGWLAERIDMTPGEIVDAEGKSLGEHEGAHAFTVGQRKGLKLGTPASDGKPRFVLEIRPKENKVIVGPEALLAVDELRGIRISWAGLPIAEAEAGSEFDCMVQVRAHGDPVDARAFVQVQEDESTVLVATLIEPMRGVAPGQTMVIYQGTRVLGQATIDSARSTAWDPSLVS
ncbi:MAG: tRNA 2-thiouridine(34) synthase MnmA, partial [Micrococcaceae bacterium]|nr:tRNA 2-thiouridine(34) synthase MnmA [Micrococcaceae bacterium]